MVRLEVLIEGWLVWKIVTIMMPVLLKADQSK